MSTERFVLPHGVRASSKQAWGIAFVTHGEYRWCHSQGPKHPLSAYTKRRAMLGALKSNNGYKMGPFRPVVIPGASVYDDGQQDLTEVYDGGPYSEECCALYRAVHLRLLTEPDLNWEELPDLTAEVAK